MFEFYKHRAFKLLPAAAALATAEQRMLMPSVKTKSVVFFAHALATVPAEAFPAVSSTFPVALNDSAFILAVLRHIDTPAGKNAFQRFAAAIKRGGSEVGRGARQREAARSGGGGISVLEAGRGLVFSFGAPALRQ